MIKLNQLARFKIGTRIYSGFAITLVLLAVLGAIGVLNLKRTEVSFGMFAGISDNTVKVAEIDREFIALRRAVIIFAGNGSEQALAQARDLVTNLRKHIAATTDALIIAERKTKLQEIGREVERYASDFESAVKLRTAREKIIEEHLNVLGLKVRKDVSQLIKVAMDDSDFEAAAWAGQLQEALMLMRIEAIRFLRQPDQKFVDSFNQRYGVFRQVLENLKNKLKSPDRKRLAQDAGEVVASYAKVFADVGKTGIEIDTLINTNMTGYANTITRNLDDFVKMQRAGLSEMRLSMEENISGTNATMIAIAIAALVAGFLIAFLIARGIVKPVSGLTAGMKELAGGNFNVILPGLDRYDEVGEMALAVETFKVKAAEKAEREAQERQEENARKAEERRLTEEREAARQKAADEKAAAERRAAMHALADQFEKAVGNIVSNVSSASTELEAAATTLTKTADTTQNLAGMVAAASEEASANVQSVASATDELSSSINEISRQVQQASRVALAAVKQAERTDGRINALSEAAQRIGNVVKLISAVAEQTNLLALNATIEAARAGASGKGFAVVAAEVKALAAQTAKATDEISSQITGMQSETVEAVAAIKEIGGTIGNISEITAAIASAVEEQGAATQEIARNVQEASKGTHQVASNIVDVNRGAGETGSASTQVLASAQSLSKEGSVLKMEVDKFLDTVRTA
jgi:methyl-accepting chemotaxis protein